MPGILLFKESQQLGMDFDGFYGVLQNWQGLHPCVSQSLALLTVYQFRLELKYLSKGRHSILSGRGVVLRPTAQVTSELYQSDCMPDFWYLVEFFLCSRHCEWGPCSLVCSEEIQRD